VYLLGKDDSWKKEFTEKARADRRKVRMIRTTTIEPYLKDYAFFALSPLYVHAGVRYSMPDQFEIEAGPQQRVVVDYQRTVIAGLARWGSLVEGIDVKVWDDFCHYLSTVLFVSFLKSIVWQVRAQEMSVEGTSSGIVVNPRQLPVRLRVFLPDGNLGRMRLRAGYPAKLWWDEPHPKICGMANKVLKAKGRIEDAC
jgi:hypothetical protein